MRESISETGNFVRRGGWVGLAFVSGAILAGNFAWQGVLGAAGALAALALYARWQKRTDLNWPWLALLLALLLGGWRYFSVQPRVTPFHIAWFADRTYDVWVTGALAQPPDVRDTYTNLRLDVQSVDTGDGDLPAHGLILARVEATDLNLDYGDIVRVRGKLQTPPENEDFSYRDYLARQDIYAYMPAAQVTRLPGWQGTLWLKAIYAFKKRALQVVRQIYPDPEASLLSGILLGVDTGLPRQLQQAFKDTGTSHIIAISGFNIAIIAAIFVSLFSRLLGARRGGWAALFGIVVYTILVGADAAVVRAAFMGGLSIFARQLGRRQDGLNTLAVVAALMTLLNPRVPWDIGFQLSFAATLGLILYGASWQAAVEGWLRGWMPVSAARRGASWLSEYVLLTFAAQLTTLPVMAYHFKRISLIAFLANPFILPAQPAVMLLGGLAVLAGLVYLPLGQVLAWLAWPFSAYTIRMVEFFARWPHGVILLGSLSLLFVLLYYLVLFAWPWLWARRTALRPATVFVFLGLVAWLVWHSLFRLPDGRLHLTFLDAGSCDAILIQTPQGGQVLINGGERATTLSDALGRRLPVFDRRLEGVIVAAPNQYQVGALPSVLPRYRPDWVLWGGNTTASPAARQTWTWLGQAEIPVRLAQKGDLVDLGEGVVLRVVDVSPRGLTLLLSWENFRALLPVGADVATLDALHRGRDIGPVSLLLLPDSGYAPLASADWLNTLNPQVVVLDVAPGDPLGLPDPQTLETVSAYPLLRTDWYGDIHIATDGHQMWLNLEKTH